MVLTRQERLRAGMRELDVAAIALIPGPNLFYLTGLSFHVSERPVVLLFPPDGPPALVLPEFETSKLATVGFELRTFSYDEDPSNQAVAMAGALSSLDQDGTNIALAPFEMRAYEMTLMQEAHPDVSFSSGERLLEPLRMVKDEREIASMRSAVQIAQSAMEAMIPLIRVGMSEAGIASELVVQLLRAGSEPELPFNPIVASGPNSALPHAVPTDRQLGEGDLLLIDWGATRDGYASDLTRTFAIRETTSELEHIYQLVWEANAAGRAAVRPGLPAANVDAETRQVIEQAGYGPEFRHRTGHGLGLMAHEPPYIRSGNERRLRAGMTFTVEPGIYIRGVGGVRIEDDVLVTPDGCETLSDFRRELEVIG